MEPIYSMMRAAMGEQGALYVYCDDSYLVAELDKVAEVQAQATTIFGKVGLKIGYGPEKTELILPRGYDRDTFPYPLDDPEIPAPRVVVGFKACMGVPCHSCNE